MTQQNQTAAREKRVDEILSAEQAARDAEARAAVHDKLIEEERRAAEAQEYAAQSQRRAAARERATAEREKAVIRYATAVKEFRQSYTELAAYDQQLGMPGFGPAVHTMELRHLTATPDTADGQLNPVIAGSLQQDIIRIIHARSLEK